MKKNRIFILTYLLITNFLIFKTNFPIDFLSNEKFLELEEKSIKNQLIEIKNNIEKLKQILNELTEPNYDRKSIKDFYSDYSLNPCIIFQENYNSINLGKEYLSSQKKALEKYNNYISCYLINYLKYLNNMKYNYKKRGYKILTFYIEILQAEVETIYKDSKTYYFESLNE